MNEDFVSFSLAKKLKEKGFRKPCVATYDKDGMLGYNNYQPKSIKAVSFDDCLCISDDLVLAPTISQVLKWLREEKKVSIIIDLTHFRSKVKWFFNCRKTVVDLFDTSQTTSSLHNSYEEASIAGIEYVLDNLIQ